MRGAEQQGAHTELASGKGISEDLEGLSLRQPGHLCEWPPRLKYTGVACFRREPSSQGEALQSDGLLEAHCAFPDVQLELVQGNKCQAIISLPASGS